MFILYIPWFVMLFPKQMHLATAIEWFEPLAR